MLPVLYILDPVKILNINMRLNHIEGIKKIKARSNNNMATKICTQ